MAKPEELILDLGLDELQAKTSSPCGAKARFAPVWVPTIWPLPRAQFEWTLGLTGSKEEARRNFGSSQLQ